MKKKYNFNDLTIRSTNRTTTDNGITAHTHSVLFERPLTVEEQEQFTQTLKSVCKIFDSSQGLDNNFLDKPHVTFTAPNLVHYTVDGRILAGSCKDELFARLAAFSQEVASIAEHDGNPVFSKLRKLKQLQDWAHSQIDNSAEPEVRPDIAITVLQLIDEVERLQNQVKQIETKSPTV
ncbi:MULTISPECIES: hypothetical protein [unclassified Microcoleus]|uniref:hypothetical protein n=1 Tax=unclassified Microcoleus TaxID=2642155 RepID=UPI0025D38975|nr:MULTISPECIES: hypothetical protein [unclassified Microcoleus]